jgi:hypothetical protein
MMTAFWKTMNDNKKVLELYLCGSWFRFASKGPLIMVLTPPSIYLCCLEPVRFKTIFKI